MAVLHKIKLLLAMLLYIMEKKLEKENRDSFLSVKQNRMEGELPQNNKFQFQEKFYERYIKLQSQTSVYLRLDFDISINSSCLNYRLSDQNQKSQYVWHLSIVQSDFRKTKNYWENDHLPQAQCKMILDKIHVHLKNIYQQYQQYQQYYRKGSNNFQFDKLEDTNRNLLQNKIIQDILATNNTLGRFIKKQYFQQTIYSLDTIRKLFEQMYYQNSISASL